MIKTHVASRFELRSLDGIRDASDVILQAEQTGSTFTGSNKAFAKWCDLAITAEQPPRTSWPRRSSG